MSRPPFDFPSAHAAALAARMVEIEAKYPLKDEGKRQNHRPFVREFLRAVYEITGKVYSPKIIRLLIKAHAKGRNPSTETLDSEKKALEHALELEAEAGRTLNEGNVSNLYQVVRQAIRDEVAAGLPPKESVIRPDKLAVDQRSFLLAKLQETEATLSNAHTEIVRVTAEAAALRAECDALRLQRDQALAISKGHAEAIMKMSESLDANRKFAMSAVDQVRGETRAWQERYAGIERQFEKLKQEAEYFRQMAYARGAPVPAHLRGDNKA